MKGLILKDFYMLVKYCKAYIFVTALFIVASFASDEKNLFLTAYPCLLSGMIPITLLAYDESSKWHEYCGTLPYSKAQIVSGKYLTGLIVQLSVLALIGISQAIRMSISGTFDLKAYMDMLFMLTMLPCVTTALCLPFVFKWGTQKGRIAYMVTIGILASIVVGVGLSDGVKIPSVGAYIVILPLAEIAIYALSWWLSIVFYKKREI